MSERQRVVREDEPTLECAHCGKLIDPHAVVDIYALPDESGATQLLAASERGHAALLETVTFVALTVRDAALLQQFIGALDARGLTCARPSMDERVVLDDDDDD